MKTMQELYKEIIAGDELKKAFVEAAKNGKVAEFLKAQGCQATAEEIKAFLAEQENGQLADEELDSAAGGTCNTPTAEEAAISMLSIGFGCAVYAIVSAAQEDHHVGQEKESEGRICNSD